MIPFFFYFVILLPFISPVDGGINNNVRLLQLDLKIQSD